MNLKFSTANLEVNVHVEKKRTLHSQLKLRLWPTRTWAARGGPRPSRAVKRDILSQTSLIFIKNCHLQLQYVYQYQLLYLSIIPHQIIITISHAKSINFQQAYIFGH